MGWEKSKFSAYHQKTQTTSQKNGYPPESNNRKGGMKDQSTRHYQLIARYGNSFGGFGLPASSLSTPQVFRLIRYERGKGKGEVRVRLPATP